MDLPGLAIRDYWKGKTRQKLWVHDEFGPKTEMPIELYFRSFDQMPELEQTALINCRGAILDIGAGAGSHVLELQARGKNITALEVSPSACTVMRDRGVKHVIRSDIFEFQPQKKFDTLLLLMNGIGLCATIAGLKGFLEKAKTLLNPNGKLLFDSSDIGYMYSEETPHQEEYYGEIKCSYEYKKRRTPTFKWLYIDRFTLDLIAAEKGWDCKILREDDKDQYLAQLKTKTCSSL